VAACVDQRDFVVASTKLVNGNTLLETVMESIENRSL